MPKRNTYLEEKKKPNICISVTPFVFSEYPFVCANKRSSVSREVSLFIDKVIETNKIDSIYFEEKKTEKFNISIEKTKAKKFKELCRDKYGYGCSAVLNKFILEELKKEANGKK